MRISRILLILAICFIALSVNAIEKNLKAVALKPVTIYHEKDINSRKVGDCAIGDRFIIVSIQDEWIEVKNGRKNISWLRNENIVLSNNVDYTGKAIINVSYARLMTKEYGDDNELVKKLQLGEIVTIIPTKYGTKVKTVDGTTGYMSKSKFLTRLGPMSKEEKTNLKFYQKIMQKEGKVYDTLYNIKAWGDTSKAKTNLIFIFSIILFFLPMFILSKYVTLVCSITIIPTWIIKLTLIFIPIYTFAYIFPIYFMTPLYRNMFLGIGFIISFIFWVTREWKKIDYHRCPSCHSMFATADKGKFFLGGWRSTRTKKYDDGTTETSITTTKRFRDDRECLICGHHWSIHRTKTATY